MRIQLNGDCETAKVLRGYFSVAGVALVTNHSDYSIQIEEVSAACITVFSMDSELERNVLRDLRRRTVRPIILEATGLNSEREIRIMVPADHSSRNAVERAVLQGVLETISAIPAKTPWWKPFAKGKR